jgi:glycosyltransferase involved in cell wall biosynthesis
VTANSASQPSLPINLALCIGSTAIDRYQPVLRHLVVGLVDAAVQVRLISADRRALKLQLGPARVVSHAPLKWPFGAMRLDSLLADLQASPPSIVHAFGGESFEKAWAIAEQYDADVIATVTSRHDAAQLTQFDLVRAQRFIAPTAPLAQVIRERARVPEQSVVLIRPGVKTSDKRRCFDREGQTPTLLCTSPFDQRSRVDTLIRAVGNVLGQKRDVMLFLLGSGKMESRLRLLVKNLEISARVTFANPLGGILDAMGSADIFVNTMTGGELDIDGLRAMGLGMAVVACKDEVIDYFRNEENALVCPPDDADQMARSILKLLDDHAYAQSLSASGLAYVKEHHSMSGMAELTLATYKEIALSRATFSIKE